ncbi:hypothetical protein AUQ37_07730 [Candidatus Methanomethylophilus sp. 1R26]|jgi:hypothetical protein|uniref:hypothetical protein n=1 Tax=Candidatus Methanomethylophilus sp. 1R26 TaxID=1769296 RepID=UPI0007364111|nr:hypothetical protein [Candidatus Methanomethylophilus sp. 1R26]MCH3977393.1 hypothetical protein [Methanomethylophilus sp.]TQS81965.1 MAG: hypothetical protein A3Q59_04275 [Methanomethylophilus alvi]WII09783.1 hypothetical protein O8W32_02865 [Methanomassiliicoccales archaeon LGM-DZ1]KUE73770.1 hypothetical protein AUQ37_07730 [Candidatus Methanomethylophilus sp. 1R26]MCI2075577.1 hypothetical protein [Methanomethylophilus sp.]
MAEPERKKKPESGEEALTERELYAALMVVDEDFRDEGREDYMDDLIRKIRRELGTDGKD